jgi:hypothetical protein
MPMIAITTSNSTSVNPGRFAHNLRFINLNPRIELYVNRPKLVFRFEGVVDGLVPVGKAQKRLLTEASYFLNKSVTTMVKWDPELLMNFAWS